MADRRVRGFVCAVLLMGAGFGFFRTVVPAQETSPQTNSETSLDPRGIDALAAHATFSTQFTFDETMLHAASQTVPDDLRPVIAKLRSITVHTFRYSAPGMYDAADLDAVRAQYSGHGWTHWMSKEVNGRAAAVLQSAPGAMGSGNAASGPPVKPADPVRTDVWVRMDHNDFDGVVLIAANEKNVNVVVVDGMISPADLLHLRGHFGIPRFSDPSSVPGDH